MTITTDNYADTTEINSFIELIDEALRALQIRGCVLLRESYSSPWAISIPAADQLARLLNTPPAAQVIAFHLVESGQCRISFANGNEVQLRSGEMLIGFGGDAHQLIQGNPTMVQPVEGLLTGAANLQPADPDTEPATSMLCGIFFLSETTLNPLYSALPRYVHSSLYRQGELHNLAGVARLLSEAVERHTKGGGYVMERLLEILCAEAIHAHVETLSSKEKNWFQGIRDPLISHAITAIHHAPDKNWSVPRLAELVTISPSRFAARFSEATGESPIVYLTRWRMYQACRALNASSHSIDRVANDVGYENQAAFSRTFKKYVGVSPTQWRNRHSPEAV